MSKRRFVKKVAKLSELKYVAYNDSHYIAKVANTYKNCIINMGHELNSHEFN